MNRGESPGRLKYSCFRDPNVSMGGPSSRSRVSSLNLNLGARDDELLGSLCLRVWCANGYVPNFVSDFREDVTGPDDD